jgi:glycosyltransferase involved in cell wall biosynthesis
MDVINVTFFGHIDDKKKYDLLSHSHLVLVPATREGWGLVVIESNAMGTPVIAYSVPGLVDSVQNEVNGLLLEKNTPDELASITISLLKDKSRLLALSKSSLGYAKKFNWDYTASEFERILMDL